MNTDKYNYKKDNYKKDNYKKDKYKCMECLIKKLDVIINSNNNISLEKEKAQINNIIINEVLLNYII
jgi:hypothetical protein